MFEISKKHASTFGLVVFAILWAFGGYYFLTTMPEPTVIRYNCELSEISPDFPKEVKEKCRELKSGRV